MGPQAYASVLQHDSEIEPAVDCHIYLARLNSQPLYNKYYTTNEDIRQVSTIKSFFYYATFYKQ